MIEVMEESLVSGNDVPQIWVWLEEGNSICILYPHLLLYNNIFINIIKYYQVRNECNTLIWSIAGSMVSVLEQDPNSQIQQEFF